MQREFLLYGKLRMDRMDKELKNMKKSINWLICKKKRDNSNGVCYNVYKIQDEFCTKGVAKAEGGTYGIQ